MNSARGEVVGCRYAGEGARAQRGPQPRFEQQCAHVVGAHHCRRGAGVGREGRLRVIVPVAIDADRQRLERPALAAMQRHDRARGRRGMAYAGDLLVLEQQLPAPHPIADLHLERRLEADEIGAEHGNLRAAGSVMDDLLWLAGQRQIQPALQVVIAQAGTFIVHNLRQRRCCGPMPARTRPVGGSACKAQGSCGCGPRLLIHVKSASRGCAQHPCHPRGSPAAKGDRLGVPVAGEVDPSAGTA